MLLRDSLEYSIWMLTAMLNDIEARMWYLVDKQKVERVSGYVDQMREIARQLEKELKDV